MTESKNKNLIKQLEDRVWEFIKPVFRLGQLYQRQQFGRLTSVRVMQQKEFITKKQ